MARPDRPGHPRGEQHPRARFRWADVALMRTLYAQGTPVCQIAAQWGCPYTTAYSVVRWETWTLLPRELRMT